MSILANVSSGAKSRPHFMIMYGPEGVGKSQFAAGAPKPIFLDVEKGTLRLNVNRLHPQSYQELQQMITALMTDKHEYQTLVIDSLDRLEQMVWTHLCEASGKKLSSIEDFGYGKGYVHAGEEFARLIKQLERLQEKTGMHVILIGHSEIKTFQDPMNNAGYDRYQLKLHKIASGIVKEAVENIFFANYEVVTKQEKGDRKAKAYGDGERVMFTERRPSFDAKNRLGLPFELKLSWSELVTVAPSGEAKPLPKKSAADLRTEIEGLLKKTNDETLKSKVAAYVLENPEDVAKLEATVSRLKTVLQIEE